MYESSMRNNVKDMFSKERSARIDWIKATLENPAADIYQGWIKSESAMIPRQESRWYKKNLLW